MKSIRKASLDELRKRHCTEGGGEIMTLLAKKHGWSPFVEENMDMKVQAYMESVIEEGEGL